MIWACLIGAALILGLVAYVVVLHYRVAAAQSQSRIDSAVAEVTRAMSQKALLDAFNVAKNKELSIESEIILAGSRAATSDAKSKGESDAAVIDDLASRGIR